MKKTRLYKLTDHYASGQISEHTTWTELAKEGVKPYLTHRDFKALIRHIEAKTMVVLPFPQVSLEMKLKMQSFHLLKEETYSTSFQCLFLKTLWILTWVWSNPKIFSIYMGALLTKQSLAQLLSGQCEVLCPIPWLLQQHSYFLMWKELVITPKKGFKSLYFENVEFNGECI